MLMLDTYFPLLVLFLLAGAVVSGLLLVSILFGPKKPSEVKDDPFECGTIGTGDAKQRFSVKFYLVATTFILFDIEIVFLYPWAVKLQELGWPGFWAMFPFLVVLGVGLVYEYKRGVLEWR